MLAWNQGLGAIDQSGLQSMSGNGGRLDNELRLHENHTQQNSLHHPVLLGGERATLSCR